tara:strand:+ start:3913 stop:4104 length:192 start_codon:yes stop_codon:yes gene_type:complete
MKINVRDFANDAVGLAGAGLLSYGAWLVYQPAGFIVLGGLLLAFAWRMAGVPAAPASLDEEQS